MKICKPVILLIFLLILVYSCTKNSTSTINVYSFQTKDYEKLRLDIKKNGDKILYQYTSKTDSTKNLELTFNFRKNFLATKQDTFYSFRKTYTTKDYEYFYYQQINAQSHVRTLVFEEDYGLLLSSGYGADFLFVKDSLSKIEMEDIFKELILELNKID